MRVLNALQIKKGAKAEKNVMGSLTQPLQFLSREEKDDRWKATTMDWLEWMGLKQIRRNSPKMLKNMQIAKGIIDKTDYLRTSGTENKELLDTLIDSDDSPLELRFYPLVTNIINTLCAEYAKRPTKIMYHAVDEFSHNDLLQMKQQEIEEVLVQDATRRMYLNLLEQGLDPEDPQDAQQIQQALSPDNIKSLPEIQEYYNKSYRSGLEEWATHQHEIDVDRFSMDELELRNFRFSLEVDRAYFHFPMYEDDYGVEIWNPLLTFVNKSPQEKYISNGYWVGNVELLTVADVIDRDGYKLSPDELQSLERVYPVRAAGYPITGYQAETNYDPSQSHEWNVSPPGIAMREFLSVVQNAYDGSDIVARLTSQTEGAWDLGTNYYLRRTTMYWKSQRKIGKLTAIKENGEVVVDIVDEDYEVTSFPVYNNTLISNRNATTLVYGEHIDWIWINEVWGGIKIGPNLPSYWGMNAPDGVSPMYIGINSNVPGPVRYQFKGDNNLYGCKLPVEGCVFSEYNTKSVSLVDLTKPYQIGFNVVNNQIQDILMDELGSIIALDPNQLPQKSLGEDWGKGNYAKAWVAMKNFNILPLDRTLQNTESASAANSPLQVLNLEQTNRLMSRINLANYYKQELFAQIGITPQRMGQEMGRQTATGVEQNLNASYAQTEMYFIQFADFLMPRVHQMRTDLAQYYNSTKPSIRLQHITSKGDRINFELNGTQLLLRDFNVFPVSNANSRAVIDELKKMVIANNTSGASIYDLGTLLTSQSLGEMTTIFNRIKQETEAKQREEYESASKEQQAQIEANLRELKLQQDFEARQAELNRQRDILVAEIRAAGYSGSVDLNQNERNDFLDNLDRIQSERQYSQAMDLNTTKETNRVNLENEKINLQKQKMATQLRSKEMDLEIARTNKNSSDLISLHKKKLSERNKKKK